MIGSYCTLCGARLFDGGKFCTKCGASVVILRQKASVDGYAELSVVGDWSIGTYKILDFSVSTTSKSRYKDQSERDGEKQERLRRQRKQTERAIQRDSEQQEINKRHREQERLRQQQERSRHQHDRMMEQQERLRQEQDRMLHQRMREQQDRMLHQRMREQQERLRRHR
jgi:hypothetical protein